MGTWGTGIFDDDTAADARDDWVYLLKDGVSPKEATANVLERFGEDDPVVLLALAATQWTWGRVDKTVKARALRALRDGSLLEGWEGDPARARKLAAVEAKLRSDPPAQRPVRVVVVPTDWEPGEILSWRAMDGRRALLRVVKRDLTYGKSSAPTCELLDWYEAGPPSKGELRALALRKAITSDDRLPSALRAHPPFTLGVFRPGEYPHRKLKRFGFKTDLPRPEPGESIRVHWEDFDKFLADYFSVGWAPGTVLALRTKEGQLFLFLVTSVHLPHDTPHVGLDVLAWNNARLPTPEEIPRLETLKSRRYRDYAMHILALKRPTSPERVSVIGRLTPRGEAASGPALDWDQIERWLVDKDPRL